ncbi:MAG: glycosyltransferase [Muribaculaceae bacterium]|nr:glycosyltransferase [Muribaculaceae bacterium]
MISVIVVTYNQGATIGRALDSILAQQTAEPVEILLADDCSRDNTEAVCRDYARRYPDKIIYLRREKNMGVTANYFDCVRRARGEWIADCAGDDFWIDNTKLQRQIEAVQANPRLSLVATDWQPCDPSGSNRGKPFGNPEGKYKSAITASDDKGRLYKRGSLTQGILSGKVRLHLCTALYSRKRVVDLLDRTGDTLLSREMTNEDQPILMSCSEGGEILWLPQCTLCYTIGTDSVSHRKDFAANGLYYLRTLREQLLLQNLFEVPHSPDLTTDIANRLNLITSMALRSDNAELREDLFHLLQCYNLPISRKCRIKLKILAHPLLRYLTYLFFRLR